MAENGRGDERTPLDYVVDFGIGSAPEAALIYGLTREQQDDLIRDQLKKKVIEPYKRKALSDVKNLDHDERRRNFVESKVRLSRNLDELHAAVRNLPDEMQDSWVLSLLDGDKIELTGGLDANTAAAYFPGEGKVRLRQDSQVPDPKTVIHEYTHKANHDMNLGRPEFQYFDMGVVPDVFSEKNLGESVQRDFTEGVLKSLPLVHGRHYSGILDENASEENFRNAIMENLRKNGGLKYDVEGNLLACDLQDIASLDPNIRISGIDVGHGEEYKDSKRLRMGKMATRDHGLLGFYDYDTRMNAALSTETPSDIAEILADRNNPIDVPKVFKETYGRMMDEYRDDPRKKLISENKFDFGQKQYASEDRVPVSFVEDRGMMVTDIYGVKKPVDGYYRVPSVYGGYNYVKSYVGMSDARRKAIKSGVNHFEYRDIDGKWRKFHPDDMKRISRAPEPPVFDQYYNYYVDLGDGRKKGFMNPESLGAYLNVNPEVRSYYRNTVKQDADGKVVTNEHGEPVMEWKPVDDVEKSFRNIKAIGKGSKELKKYADERRLAERIRKEKAIAKDAMKIIRRIR